MRREQGNLISNYSDVECHCSMSIAAPEAPRRCPLIPATSNLGLKNCNELCRKTINIDPKLAPSCSHKMYMVFGAIQVLFLQRRLVIPKINRHLAAVCFSALVLAVALEKERAKTIWGN